MAPASRGVARRVTRSGLVVLTEWMPDSPTVAVVLSVLGGARSEPVDRQGLATLVADVLLEGTKRMPGVELAWAIDSLGASIDVVTGYEAARVVVTGVGESAPELVELVAEVACRPALEPGAVERSRRRLLREIEEEQDDPYTVAQRALFRLVFGDHPRGRAGIGTEAGVSAISLEDIRSFHSARYRLGSAVLAVAGRFDSDAVVAAAERLEERAGPGVDAPVSEPHYPTPSSRLITREIEQVHLAVGFPGVRRTDPLFLPASVLDVIFGDSAGFASRLATRLREGDGLAYMVEGDVVGTSGIDPGLVWVYTATAPERTRAALAAIESETRRAFEDPPSDEELATAVAFLKGRRILERETAEARAASLVRLERYGLGLDHDRHYPALLDRVSTDDVASVASRLLRPEAASIVAVGPQEEPLPHMGR